MLLYKKLLLMTFSTTLLILIRILRDMINVLRLLYTELLSLSDFNETLRFLATFSKNPRIKFMKIRPMGAELFHADGLKGRHDETHS